MSFSALPNLISLFANRNEASRDNMSPDRPAPMQMVSVQEFVLGAYVVLPEDVGVGLELFRANWFACQMIEDLR
jgi:hypothetical protein